jgi:ABC-2 type transport system permease protein
MSTPSAVVTPAVAAGWRAWVAGNPPVRMFVTLVRREFWEHRSLWRAPLVVTALLLVCALLTHGTLKIDAADSSEWLIPQNKPNIFALGLWALTLPHYLVMTLLLSFYLLDCLYAERKDRSILFWKSLPVSDRATVASKLVVACVVVPLGTFVLALVTDILFTAIWDLRAFITHNPELVLWDTVAFLKTQALMFLGLVISILWYSPFLGAFLLASALVRRNVLMWVTVVPLLVVIFEQIAFGTHWLSNFLDYRGEGIWDALHVERALITSIHSVGGGPEPAEIVSIPEVLDRVHVGPAFTNIDLWLGVAFAAACAAAAAWVRGFRDET